MKELNLVQGSPEWHSHRANPSIRNASDAPAMMGDGYITRAELLRQTATGIRHEPSSALQALFDKGHRAEAAIRPVIEKLIGDDLYPVTGISDQYPHLSASFDGITMDGETAFECKLWNEDLVACIEEGRHLPMKYQWQMQHQFLVSGAKRTYFVTAKEDGSDHRHVVVEPNAELMGKVLWGWDQFNDDLAAYVHEAPAAEVVAEPVDSLPSVSVQVNGELSVVSNLAAFGDRLRAFIAGLDPKPSDDKAFANAENEIKVLKRAEEALDAAEAAALAQVACIDELRILKATLHELTRKTRLAREKLVAARKDQIRIEITQDAARLLSEHCAALSAKASVEGCAVRIAIPADFAGAIKGKRTVSSLRDAASAELARAKIDANMLAERVTENQRIVDSLAGGHLFLFADRATLVLKHSDDLAAIIKTRISEHTAREAAKLAAEQERIERETRLKLEREANARADAEEAARIAAEIRQKAQVEKAAEDFGGTGKVVVTESAPAPAVIAEVPAPAVAPKAVKYDMPHTATIVEAVANQFGVPRHIAASWLLSINQAELAKAAA